MGQPGSHETIDECNELSQDFFEQRISGKQSAYYLCHSHYSKKLVSVVDYRQAAYLHLIQHFHGIMEAEVGRDIGYVSFHNTEISVETHPSEK